MDRLCHPLLPVGQAFDRIPRQQQACSPVALQPEHLASGSNHHDSPGGGTQDEFSGPEQAEDADAHGRGCGERRMTC